MKNILNRRIAIVILALLVAGLLMATVMWLRDARDKKGASGRDWTQEVFELHQVLAGNAARASGPTAEGYDGFVKQRPFRAGDIKYNLVLADAQAQIVRDASSLGWSVNCEPLDDFHNILAIGAKETTQGFACHANLRDEVTMTLECGDTLVPQGWTICTYFAQPIEN